MNQISQATATVRSAVIRAWQMGLEISEIEWVVSDLLDELELREDIAYAFYLASLDEDDGE